MSTPELDPTDYYRLPWTLTDNILSWLEPTKRCNLYCEGCYSKNEKGTDKTLAQVRADMDLFTSQRNVDSISVAGGDPLVHPEIVEITRMIKEDYGLKPVLNTNGLGLTDELLEELTRAGIFGFTFHIDSSQGRPGWEGKNELELNELRLKYAKMCSAKGLSVSFNSTVFPETLHYVPEMMKWAQEHIDIVNIMVFILFRTTRTNEFDYYANGKLIDPKELIYYDEDKLPKPLTAAEAVGAIREADPLYEPSAYLGGTKDPASFKWLLASRLGSKKKIHGYVGPRFQELSQTTHHMMAGRYLAYSDPKALRWGRSMMAAFSPLDAGVRKAALNYGKNLISSPLSAKDSVHFQSIVIIQPIDMMDDGETNMCDGCPDMTIHDGELVWSCRLEEKLRHGCFLNCVPKKAAAEETEKVRELSKKSRSKKKSA